jgi:hypothetical protein
VSATTAPGSSPGALATFGRVYVGRRLSGGRKGPGGHPTELAVRDDDQERPVPFRDPKHSPAGLEWGYAGSGPTETARQLLWEHLGHEPRPATYQDFKFAFIATAPREGFEITAVEVDAWLTVHLGSPIS